MTKREQWRAKAARYLRWHRAAMRSRFPTSEPDWFRMYEEAKAIAHYWARWGEDAPAPTWYHFES